MSSYRLDTYGDDDQLEEARFATLAEAREVAEATEHGGNGYMAPRVIPSEDEPTITAADYLAAAWPGYPGPCPEGKSWEDWLAENNVD